MKGLAAAALLTFGLLDLCYALVWMAEATWTWALLSTFTALGMLVMARVLTRS